MASQNPFRIGDEYTDNDKVNNQIWKLHADAPRKPFRKKRKPRKRKDL